MFHDLCALITNNPFGSFIIILASIWAAERVVTALINRKKPECECDCCVNEHDDDDDDEDRPIKGGRVEEDE